MKKIKKLSFILVLLAISACGDLFVDDYEGCLNGGISSDPINSDSANVYREFDSIIWGNPCNEVKNIIYDVYFDTVNPPKLVLKGTTDTILRNIKLLPNHTYYTKITVTNTKKNLTKEGKIHVFFTDRFPQNHTPANKSTINSNYVTLTFYKHGEVNNYYGRAAVYLRALTPSSDTNGIDTICVITADTIATLGPLKNKTQYQWFIRYTWYDAGVFTINYTIDACSRPFTFYTDF